jgi:hypothetical protein
MLIYLFRVTTDEQEDFLREIEIQPRQSFLDFHVIIMESSELLHCERASFFITDKRFRKEKEITLKTEKRQVRKYDEDMDQVITETVTMPVMKNSVLKNFIEDPHQKLIYEFQGKEHHSFYIDLFRILKSDGMPSYPRCVRQKGELPRKPLQPLPLPPKPELPVIPVPKIVIPKLENLSKLDNIVENEAELAAIDSELASAVDPDPGLTFIIGEQVAEEPDEFSYGDEEETMEHLEDYEDIENLDGRYSGFDRDQDDY